MFNYSIHNPLINIRIYFFINLLKDTQSLKTQKTFSQHIIDHIETL